MNPSIEEGKDLMLRVFAKELRAQRPGLTHARSYQLAQEAHPELAEEFDEHPTATPAYQPPLPGKVGASDQAKLDELLSRFMPKKVQARKPREDEGLMLVYAKDGTELGTVYFD